MKKVESGTKGITLISLVITVIVLLILASIGVYSGVETVKSSKFTAFSAGLKIMQIQVNSWYQKYLTEGTVGDKTGTDILSLGAELSTVQEQVNKVFTEGESGITDTTGYRYFNNDLLKQLGVEGVDGDFFINISKRSVVSYEGMEYEGKTYYTVDSLPDGFYNVEYEGNSGLVTFDVKATQTSDENYRVTISNIKYDGNINKWYVQYKKEGSDSWNTAADLEFTVIESGRYIIKVYNGDVVGAEEAIVGFFPGVIASKNEKYKDKNGDIATIPAGFEILEEAAVVDQGLVIQDRDKNQFVWVPVADINDMAQCETAGGTCKLVQQEDGTIKCTTHNSTNIVGKLYATTAGENFGTVNNTYNANSGFREPAIVTGNSTGTGTSCDGQYYASADSSYTSANDMLEDLKDQYKKMAASVAKNGGFYIGRYEMTLSTATTTSAGTSGTACSKQGVIPTAADNSATNMWYGLYKTARTYTVEEDSVVSGMVWGSQYDAMLNWIQKGDDASKVKDASGIGNNSSRKVATTGNTSYSNDSLNNIRDLGGNLQEWTLEAYTINARVLRRRPLLQRQFSKLPWQQRPVRH